MGTVHGVPCLEGDHAGPAQFLEVESQLGGRVPKGDIIVMVKAGYGRDGAANVVLLDGVAEVFDSWMLRIATEDFFGFFLSADGIRGLCSGVILSFSR